MKRKMVMLNFLLVLVISLSGCAAGKEYQMQSEIQQLKDEVSSLETRILSKEEELNDLKNALVQIEKEKQEIAFALSRKKIIGEAGTRPTIDQVKIALRNAGYNPGVISGKMEKETFNATRDFQKANNLFTDGIAGKKTWAVLKKYLYEKPETE